MTNPTVAQRVRSLVDRVGVNKASKMLGLGKEPTVRIVAGLDVRAGTLALAERSLEGVERASASPPSQPPPSQGAAA